MDARQIRMVLAVAECGSISAAAAKLFMSAQGLKKALDQIERNELDCELFIRTNKGAKLTEAGKAFCTEAPALLAQMDRFAERVRNAQETQLRISTWSNKRIPILDAICAEYRRRYPTDSVTFVPASEQRVLEDIADGLADITFQSLEMGVVNHNLLTYSSSGIIARTFCLMSDNHPLAWKDTLAPEDLLSYPVAIVGKYGTGTGERLAERVGATSYEIISYDRYPIMEFCLKGGLCVCDEYLAFSFPEFVAKSIPWVEPMEIRIAHRHSPSPQVRRFIEVARETAAQLYATA